MKPPVPRPLRSSPHPKHPLVLLSPRWQTKRCIAFAKWGSILFAGEGAGLGTSLLAPQIVAKPARPGLRASVGFHVSVR